MTFRVHGIDALLFLIAVLCFLVAAILAWAHPGSRAILGLICAGLCLSSLTNLVR